MSRSFGFGVVLLVVAACGGKTDDNSGSGTPSGGSGPDGGGSTSGSGGTSALGGGGTGALGGGGTGAFGGGGTGGWGAKVDAACQAMSPLPCALPSCTGELSQAVKNAISAGCDAQIAAVLDCALSYPMYCANGEPQLAIECQKLVDALDQCAGTNCNSWGASDGSCGVDCKGWGADCKPDSSGSVLCVCTLGPATGKQFPLPGSCGSPSWQDQVAQHCQ